MPKMEGKEKQLFRTMEAEDVTLLRYLLDLSLRRLSEDGGIDIILLIGVDGRIFASVVPDELDSNQYKLLNLVKTNLYHICSQLMQKNLKVTYESYPEGRVIISGVGDSAFMAMISTSEAENLENLFGILDKWSVIVNHIFQIKPLRGPAVESYDESIQKELKDLSRKLFVERFAYTKKYRKNMSILEFIKKKLSEIVGVGMVNEIITLTFNELGTTAPYMTDDLWSMFIERVINEYIRKYRGDIVADECYRAWIPELQQKLKTFI